MESIFFYFIYFCDSIACFVVRFIKPKSHHYVCVCKYLSWKLLVLMSELLAVRYASSWQQESGLVVTPVNKMLRPTPSKIVFVFKCFLWISATHTHTHTHTHTSVYSTFSRLHIVDIVANHYLLPIQTLWPLQRESLLFFHLLFTMPVNQNELYFGAHGFRKMNWTIELGRI